MKPLGQGQEGQELELIEQDEDNIEVDGPLLAGDFLAIGEDVGFLTLSEG